LAVRNIPPWLSAPGNAIGITPPAHDPPTHLPRHTANPAISTLPASINQALLSRNAAVNLIENIVD
jgi:hypothetical protein